MKLLHEIFFASTTGNSLFVEILFAGNGINFKNLINILLTEIDWYN